MPPLTLFFSFLHWCAVISMLGVVGAQNDPDYSNGEQWHLRKVGAYEAWNYSKGEGVIVAVLDTGVDYTHPDLKGKVLVKQGYDFVNDDADAMDDNGHGTAVAAVLGAATNNGIGGAGMGWEVKILPVKVMSAEMKSFDSQITKGIYHAVEQGARIISMSISSPTRAKQIEEAIDFAWSKGCVIVSSAGNTGEETVRYPAALKNVIGVGVTDRADQQPAWATYGPHIDLTAPGRRLKTIDLENGYSFKSGSSYATPLVAGTAALLAALPQGLSNTEIVMLLKESAEDLGEAGYDRVYGFGRLNAGAALRAAMRDSGEVAALSVEEADPLEDDPVYFSVERVSAEMVTFRVNIPLGVTYKIMGSNDSSLWGVVYHGKGNGLFETFSIKKPEGYALFEMEY